jgi:asparaginyl-tRNA synthetase
MFNERVKIKDLLASAAAGQEVTVMGWVRTFRNNQFIALNDGSTNNNLQVVVELGRFPEDLLKRITTGASLKVKGAVEASLGKGQAWELKAKDVIVLGDSDLSNFHCNPKAQPGISARNRTSGSARIRLDPYSGASRAAFAIHQFFNERGFVYMHTPVITASDAEGAGEMFKVTTLPLDNIPRTDTGGIDFKEDFFGKATNLTVSGQLEGELSAMAFSDIYTFGPTFRAENSNTTRHLAEFWMIEPRWHSTILRIT